MFVGLAGIRGIASPYEDPYQDPCEDPYEDPYEDPSEDHTTGLTAAQSRSPVQMTHMYKLSVGLQAVTCTPR